MKTSYVAVVAASAFVLCLGFGASSASAGQCRDPWVTKAVTQVTGHAPNGSGESGECSIQNYGQGHWSSYQDLVSKVRAHFGQPSAQRAAAPGQCRDPWVTQAVRQVTGRPANGSGETGECSITNYGGGHWSSYPDLVAKVRAHFGMGIAQGARPGMGAKPGINVGRIANPGAGVIPAGAGNVIPAGAGN